MENTLLKTLLYYNPWIQNPTGWSQAAKAHLLQAEGRPYIKRLADDNSNCPQNHKVNLVVGPRQAGKSILIWHTLSRLGPKILYVNANKLTLRQCCVSPVRVAADIADPLPDARAVSDTFHIKHVAKFRQLLALVAGQISNLVNCAEWSSITGLDVKTVESYAKILAESHIIRLLPPIVGGRRAEITSKPKVFFVDSRPR